MYVTVCDPCLDGYHDGCEEKHAGSKLRRDREAVRAAGLAGGGSCICAVCDPRIKRAWYEHVRDQRIAARAASR